MGGWSIFLFIVVILGVYFFFLSFPFFSSSSFLCSFSFLYMAGLEWEGGFGLENWHRPLSLYMLLGGDISELLKMWLLFFFFFWLRLF